jgi:hypothetical protein
MLSGLGLVLPKEVVSRLGTSERASNSPQAQSMKQVSALFFSLVQPGCSG